MKNDRDLEILAVLKRGPSATGRLIDLLRLIASISDEPEYEVAERLRDCADRFEHPVRN
jgi:hypothetical protein